MLLLMVVVAVMIMMMKKMMMVVNADRRLTCRRSDSLRCPKKIMARGVFSSSCR